MQHRYDAIVVGGGVNGGSIAYTLTKRGKKVLLLEKDRIASKSSGAAAGMLAAQAELDGESPLFPLASKSREMFTLLAEEIRELSGIDIGLFRKGMLKVAQTPEEASRYKQVVRFQQAAGEQAEWLTGNEARRKESALSDAVVGAMHIEKDGQVSAPDLTIGLIKSAAILGADIKEQIEVREVLTEAGKVSGVQTSEGAFTSEHVIVAGGAWSEALVAKTGLQLETLPVKGECFSVLTSRPLLDCTVFSPGCYLVPKKGGRTIIGATERPYQFNNTVTVEGISFLMEKAIKLVPAIAEAEWEKAWAGIRPETADSLPYLGEHPAYEGLFIAAGHYRNGILLSPVTGESIADLVERKTPAFDLTPFHLEGRTVLHS